MTTYVTVAMERIQTHLARSRRLWGRRGASEEILHLTMMPATAKEQGRGEPPVSEALRMPGVRESPDGLDIDGVLWLEADDEGTGRDAGYLLARRMRQRLPACTVTVRWVVAKSDETLPHMLGADMQERWKSVTFQPSPYEFPLVRFCDECGIGPAVGDPVRRFEEVLRLCRDCFVRLEGRQGRQTTVGQWTVVNADREYPNRFCAEWWLLKRLNDRRSGHPPLRGSVDLNELGQLVRPTDGRGKRTHRDNHTALISADGNGLGAIFDGLRQRAVEDGTTMRKVSQAIKEGMARAVERATTTIILPDDGVCPVVPHIMGGDDLLISVPAERCWEFLEVFLGEFRTQMETSDANLAAVTMSAGMVICKAETPIGNQFSMANRLMREAKRQVAGQGWSFTWLDLTQDGPDGSHQVWTLDSLANRRGAIERAHGLPANSMQSMLAALSGNDLDTTRRKLDYLTHRMPEVADLMKELGIKPGSLENADVETIIDIASIRRWWR